MTLEIHPLKATDRADWHRLWTAYLAFYETELPPEIFDTSFARLLSDDPNSYHGLIARRDGAAVGLAHFLVHRDLWRLSDACYLGDLFVDPDVRGSGAGRALIEAVEAAAARMGATELHWQTQDHNAVARKLYDQVARLTPFVQYTKDISAD